MATTDKDKKAVVHRFFDAWNEADFEVIEEVIATDAEHHDPMDPPGLPAGPEGEKQLIRVYQSAFPDATLTIEDMLAEGDKVAARWTATGTHEGEFMGIEPTGNEVEITGFEINQIKDDQIIESWVLLDAFGLMQQLGVIEPPNA